MATALASCSVPGSLVAGGQTFRCRPLSGGLMGPGLHLLSVTLRFSDGSATTAVARWLVVATDRPLMAASVPNMFPFRDPSGAVATFNTNGSVDASNPFFRDLGTNGRSCVTCHMASDGFGLSALGAQARFARSGGRDPLFAAIDGANCPTAPSGDAASRSLVLNNGLIRIFLPIPAGAEFTVTVVHDPYGCALLPDPGTGQSIVSVYRRPLPTTNLHFLSAVMFDGRQTVSPLDDPATFAANLVANLLRQAHDATLVHAQASSGPTEAQLSAIANLQLGLFTAQDSDDVAGRLAAGGGRGGALPVVSQPYYPGINDPFGADPTGASFNPLVFGIYDPWFAAASATPPRRSVARGQSIFNGALFAITGVKGLNDPVSSPVILGGCTTCHNTPNVGNHSRPLLLDIGTSHSRDDEPDAAIKAALGRLSVPDLPIFKLTCGSGPGSTVTFTSDPARALVTGLCADVSRGKVPVLRGLAARAPFFHNGAAASLAQLVEFYNERFQIGLAAQDQADLVAFLRSL
jgi:hypothetical protein